METHAKPVPAAARTTSIASSMMAVGARSVGLQKGVRWKPIRTGVFYPVRPPCAPRAVAGPQCEPQGRPGAGAPRPEASNTNWPRRPRRGYKLRSEEHTSELQSRLHLVCRLLLEKKKKKKTN